MMKRNNILFIVLDTVRAKSTSFGDRDITPTIAAEQKRGRSYQKAIAPTPWSLSSHASMFTGKYATEHGATQESKWLSDEYTLLAERLSNVGYRTGIFTGNLFTSAAFNMSRGFETTSFSLRRKLFRDGHSFDEFIYREDYPDALELAKRTASEALGGDRKTAANIVWAGLNEVFGRGAGEIDDRKQLDEHIIQDVERFIKSNAGSDQPFFGFVNILAAHGPWEYREEQLRAIDVDPAEYGTEEEWEYLASVSEDQWPHAAGELTFDDHEREMLRLLYESWVHRADEFAGRLLQTLSEAGIREETVVVLTSDHGEATATNGVLGHTVSLQDDCVWVPLTITGPGVDATEVNGVVSLKDLYGTILSHAAVQTNAPGLRDTGDPVMTERFGISLRNVSDSVEKINERIREYTHHHRKLYTSSSSVEQCVDTGTTFGDEGLLPELTEFVDELETHNGTETQVNVADKVTDRLEQLGYGHPGK